MNTLVLCSQSPSYARLADITTPNHEAYCARHGYDSLVIHNDRDSMAEDRISCLTKLFGLLRSGVWDRVLMVESDVVFMELGMAIENKFPEVLAVQVAREEFGPKVLNSGVILWPRSQTALRLLERTLREKEGWRYKPCTFQDWLTEHQGELQEQGCLQVWPSRHMNSSHRVHVASDWRPGDWIAHFYWHRLPEKEALARAYIAGRMQDVESINSRTAEYPG